MTVADLIIQSFDPGSAAILGMMWYHLKSRLNGIRDRISRLENTHIADGGEDD